MIPRLRVQTQRGPTYCIPEQGNLLKLARLDPGVDKSVPTQFTFHLLYKNDYILLNLYRSYFIGYQLFVNAIFSK